MSDMSLHTPGPWRDIGLMPHEDDPENGERFVVQVLEGRDCGYGVACALPCGTPDKNPDRTSANARLIALAPELLDLIRTMLIAIDGESIANTSHEDSCGVLADAARELITKAAGGAA